MSLHLGCLPLPLVVVALRLAVSGGEHSAKRTQLRGDCGSERDAMALQALAGDEFEAEACKASMVCLAEFRQLQTSGGAS